MKTMCSEWRQGILEPNELDEACNKLRCSAVWKKEGVHGLVVQEKDKQYSLPHEEGSFQYFLSH